MTRHVGRQLSPVLLALAAVGLLPSSGAHAQAPTATDAPPAAAAAPSSTTAAPAAAPEEKEEEEAWGFGAHPIIGYEPEASWTLGAGATIYVNPGPDAPGQRPDEYTLNATYSLRGQGTLSLDATNYLRGDDLELASTLVLTNTPSSFYGIGPDTPESAEEEFVQSGIHPTLALLLKVAPGLNLGPQVDFFYSAISGVQPDGMLASGAVAGAGTTHESGLGLVLSYDTTNRKLYKRQGTRINLSGTVYPTLLGSSHAFAKTGLGLRHYLGLPWRMVLGLQFALRSSHGDVPFFYLESLGNKRLLRGYSGERHVAHHFVGAQAELRYPILWRFGGTVFFGAADVEEALSALGSTLRAAGGLGLRFALNRSQTINLRFDLTLNSDGELEKYIKLGEAF